MAWVVLRTTHAFKKGSTMNGRIVERISKQHASDTYHLQDVDGRTRVKFDSASPFGDDTRYTAMVTEQQAKLLMDRWPQAYRIADDLEQVEREKDMAEAIRASKDTLMGLIRDNADEIRGILGIDDGAGLETVKRGPGRPRIHQTG